MKNIFQEKGGTVQSHVLLMRQVNFRCSDWAPVWAGPVPL